MMRSDFNLCSVSGAEEFVSVSVGQDCVLPCFGREGVRVSVLQWIQSDSDKHLLVYRAGRVLHGYEDPVYTNRVQLLEPKLLRGNLSVVLKNVTLKDTGIYRCQALYEDKQKVPQFIHLRVTERGPGESFQHEHEVRVSMKIIVLCKCYITILLMHWGL
uniref:Ig-like domain-containing protein n=1 Tax=Neogobius melanostomus TaxID=47308 RepID=A0A8C6WYH8_9GOBI